MSEEQVPQTDKVARMRVIVAGAAHGAWSALLVGIIIGVVGWIGAVVVMRGYPEWYVAVAGTPIDQLWSLVVRWIAAWKLLLFGWVLFATFLSYWWRALK